MTPTVITPEVMGDLYGWLVECASARKNCPSNQDICGRYGFKSWSTAARAIKKLENLGRISVVRRSTLRLVTITETGAQTVPDHRDSCRKHSALSKPAALILPLPPRKGRKGRQCQWIAGEPTPDDKCKCLAETLPESQWCAAHHARAYAGYVPTVYRVDAKRIPA